MTGMTGMTAHDMQDTHDAHGWTTLDHAAGRGDVAEVRRLLPEGADAPRAGTAYRIALAAGHVEAARVLRDAAEEADHVWRPYCKAYPLAELQAFEQWPADCSDEVLFVHDDFTVTRGFLPGVDVVLGAPTPEWERFCRETLGFAAPDDFDLVPGRSHA